MNFPFLQHAVWLAGHRRLAIVAVLLMAIFVTGNVVFASSVMGVNITTGGTLTVLGTATSTFAGGFVVGTSSPYSLIINGVTGAVGLGQSSAPRAQAVRLAVNGAIRIDGTSDTSTLGAGTNALNFNNNAVQIYRNTANQLIFHGYAGIVGGNNTTFDTGAGFIFNSAGNFGIGTSSPYNPFTIYKAGSTATSSPQMSFSASSTISGLGNFLYDWSVGPDIADVGKFKISSSTAVGTNDRFVIDSIGRVGIGTSTPTGMLTVVSNSSNQNIIDSLAVDSPNGPTLRFKKSRGTHDVPIVPNDGDVTGMILFSPFVPDSGYTDSAIIQSAVDGTIVSGQRAPARLTFSTATINSDSATERMRITSGGLVGIGTSSPASLLHVSSGTNATTTVEFGAQSATSKTCFNVRDALGVATSFYFVGTTMVVEANRCK